jgi:protein-tyrosine phosphatase
MSFKYAVILSMLAVAMVALAVVRGGLALLWIWPAISVGVVAAGYAGLGPRVFGKSPNGHRARCARLVLAPYLLLALLVFHLRRVTTGRACCQQVLPGLWLGRRPQPHEIPADVELVIDLTAEMREPRGVFSSRRYMCFPTLDATAPRPDDVRAILEAVSTCHGEVYIHCAAGHGRSAAVVACIMIQRGCARTLDEAEAQLRLIRPGIRLNQAQRSLIQELALPQARRSVETEHQQNPS